MDGSFSPTQQSSLSSGPSPLWFPSLQEDDLYEFKRSAPGLSKESTSGSSPERMARSYREQRRRFCGDLSSHPHSIGAHNNATAASASTAALFTSKRARMPSVDDEIALCSSELAHLGLIMRVPSLDSSVNGGSIGSVASTASSSSAASSVFADDLDRPSLTSGCGGGSRMRKRQRRHNSRMALDSSDFKGILQSLFQKDGPEEQAAGNVDEGAGEGLVVPLCKADADPETLQF